MIPIKLAALICRLTKRPPMVLLASCLSWCVHVRAVHARVYVSECVRVELCVRVRSPACVCARACGCVRTS